MADDKLVLSFLCVFSLSFLPSTESSTVTLPPIDLCAAANYDIWNLTTKLWKFSPQEDYCLRTKTGKTTVGKCEITMGFCRAANRSQNCANAAVCESYSSGNDTYNLATYVQGTNPFNTTAVASNLGFTTSYPNGETYIKPDNTSCLLNTVMTFVCKDTAFWEYKKFTEDILNVPVNTTVTFTHEDKLCTYNFTFDYAGACPLTVPGSPVMQLSAGSVLLLIFFVSVILYFVLGCFINIARGRSRQDIIPHQKFWAMLPVYIMDGIQFTITCGEQRSRQTYESI